MTSCHPYTCTYLYLTINITTVQFRTKGWNSSATRHLLKQVQSIITAVLVLCCTPALCLFSDKSTLTRRLSTPPSQTPDPPAVTFLFLPFFLCSRLAHEKLVPCLLDASAMVEIHVPPPLSRLHCCLVWSCVDIAVFSVASVKKYAGHWSQMIFSITLDPLLISYWFIFRKACSGHSCFVTLYSNENICPQ